MSGLLRVVHLLTLGVWIGSVVFFSFFTAPALFGALGREAAGRAVSAIFPRYYALGAACGALALISGLLLAAKGEARGRFAVVELVIVAVMTGIVLYAGWVLLPRAAEARRILAQAPEADPARAEAQARFAALHRRSVLLNGAVLLLGAAAFALGVWRPPR